MQSKGDDSLLATPKAQEQDGDKMLTVNIHSTSNDITPTPARRKFKDVHPIAQSTPMLSDGPVLLEDSMKFAVTCVYISLSLIHNILYYIHSQLPDECQVTRPELQDDDLKDQYMSLPNLRYVECFLFMFYYLLCVLPFRSGSLYSWASTQTGQDTFVNLIAFSGWAEQCQNLDYEYVSHCLCIAHIK